MSKSRRNFIQAATLTLLATSAFPAFSQSEVKKTFDPENLTLLETGTKETFERYVGLKFAVYSESRPVGSMTLLAVTDLPPVKQPAGVPVARELTGYILRFRGYGTALPQEVYTLNNPALGSMTMLLVPSGLPGASTTYSAVIVRLVE